MRYHLAQLNIAVAEAPLSSPEMHDFVTNRERIKALATADQGFVWQHISEDGDAHVLLEATNPVLFNLSIWRSLDALIGFVYKSEHAQYIRCRKDWFTRLSQPHVVLWWVAQNHRPSVREAKSKLDLLVSRGPTPEAFAFRRIFPPPSDAPSLTSEPEAMLRPTSAFAEISRRR
ncbi:DUF3291 domain-containing protein [Thiomonas sp. FB-Cd]|uniref:DUF3291 domain-containing protein n=1 Tax=Thiomonas sp. FB-Cd TaxID=1158292 RepID=UPI0009E0B5CF|nr:DUF3291 domain-containing protein [Thiomonas sp. FB-Cd]